MNINKFSAGKNGVKMCNKHHNRNIPIMREGGRSLMKQMIQIIRKADVEKEYINTLKLELDYELATLYDAMQQNDSSQKDKSKKRLAEIQVELEALHAL